MKHLLRTASLVLVLSALAATMTACKQEYDSSCSFPDATQLDRTCLGDGSGDTKTGGTCVYRQAPDCDTALCAVYEGHSDAFCTQACEQDDDCPTDSTCEDVVNGQSSICVPSAYQ